MQNVTNCFLIKNLLTLVEESSLLMVLPREIVYHCFPVFNDIIAVLLNMAATYLFEKVMIINKCLAEFQVPLFLNYGLL